MSRVSYTEGVFSIHQTVTGVRVQRHFIEPCTMMWHSLWLSWRVLSKAQKNISIIEHIEIANNSFENCTVHKSSNWAIVCTAFYQRAKKRAWTNLADIRRLNYGLQFQFYLTDCVLFFGEYGWVDDKTAELHTHPRTHAVFGRGCVQIQLWPI